MKTGELYRVFFASKFVYFCAVSDLIDEHNPEESYAHVVWITNSELAPYLVVYNTSLIGEKKEFICRF